MRAFIDGGSIPNGTVTLSGAKNSATRLLAASLLSSDPTTLTGFPTKLVDVQHELRFIHGLGAEVDIDHEAERITVNAENLHTSAFTAMEPFPIRPTYLLVAGQILKAGRARIPYPRGCSIGNRGHDLHVMVWRALGCSVEETPEAIEVRGNRFTGGRIEFPFFTVGGTENALLCASVAAGETEIANAYITPEVEDLIDYLRRSGADVDVFGNSLIRVRGVSALRGVNKAVMPDRIEALTWMVYALMARGSIRIDNVPFSAMQVPLLHLEDAGVDIFRNSKAAYVNPDCLEGGSVQPFEVACGTHPGVISDMQPFFVLLALLAQGRSRVFDYRYPERIAYVDELRKLCADGSLRAEPGIITIDGGGDFRSGSVRSTDLRGSMVLVLAALVAPGRSEVQDVEMALRGYNRLPDKLAKLGIEVEFA